jgi:hypothetical protein
MRKATRERIFAAGNALANLGHKAQENVGSSIEDDEAYEWKVAEREWNTALSQYRADVAASKRPKKKARGR